MERVDGTQARLKRGIQGRAKEKTDVERVDGTQARLKHASDPSTIVTTVQVERVDGTQARLKPV